MKKVSSFVVFLLLGLGALVAKPVDPATALRVADNFFRERGLYDKRLPDQRLRDITASTPFGELYVFATTSTRAGSGFVIVAGDDAARPILGYSDCSAFAAEGLPPQVMEWLRGYEEQIREARAAGYIPSEYVSAEWSRLSVGGDRRENTVVVDALLTTAWNQSPYYNQLCPYDSEEGDYSVTGCVATAMGQVMKYWNHPATGTGSHSYSSNYGQLTANFAGTTYDWANMPDALSSASTAAEKTAVATLLYHCGVAVEMDYSPSGSGATTIGSTGATAEAALRDYFKYSASIHGDYMMNYSDGAWKQMLMADLNAGRPVVYRGQGSAGGHCFVCDGYTTDTLFHFNFGWSGYYNGFYPLTAVNPTSSMDFNTYQGAIMGIVPNGGGLAPRNLSASGLQPQSASIVWSDPSNPSAASYQVAYGLASTFDTTIASTYTLVACGQTGCQLSGLTPYTAYKVAVRGLYSNTVTPWSEVLDFTTAALPQPLPLTAGFEGSMPAYWSQEYVSGSVDWRFDYTGSIGHPSTVAAGTFAARFSTNNYNNNSTRLVTPLLNITGDAAGDRSGTVTARVAFAHSHEDWSGDQDVLNVYFRTSPTNAWTLLASYSNSVSGWQRDTLLLPAISGTCQVAFEAVSHYGYGVCLDDVSIYAERTAVNYAAAPYDCNFGDTAENANWVLLNGTDTNRWYIGMGTASGYSNPYALYVSSDNGMSNYYATTEASTVFAYRDITLSAGQYAFRYDWTGNGESGRDFMRVALVPENVSLTPGVQGSWGVGTLPAGALALDGGSLLNGQSSWQMQDGIIDLPASGNYRIVAYWHNDDRYGYQPPAAFDNLKFRQNSCVLPVNLTVGSISSSSASLSWTAGGSESRWMVTVGSQTYYTNSPSYTLTGLMSNTEYTAEVRSVCGNDTSLVPRRLTFRTECAAAVMPYRYGFEDAPIGAGSAMPDCWHRISSTNFPYVVQSNAHTGSRTLYFYNVSTQYAVLPSVAEPVTSLKMKLWVRKAASSPALMVAGIMSDPNNAATFVPIDTLDNITTAYSQFVVSYENYGGGAAFPALLVPAGTANYLYVDDVEMSTCHYEIGDSNSFVETFESGSATRGCWSQENENGNVAWTYNNGGYYSHPASAHGGTANAMLYSSTRGSQTRLISPMFDASALPAVKFSFWHAQALWGGDQDSMSVYYRTGSVQPWVRLETFTSNITAWTQRQYYLPNSDSLQVSFLGTARFGYGVCIDDVTIESSPFCGSVSALTAAIIDTARSTVQLNWSGSLVTGSYFRLQYGPQGFDTAHAGTIVNNITNTSYTLPLMTVNTAYDFYVTTVCNSQQESMPVQVSLYVPSLPVRAFPYTCSFDSVPENNQWIILNGTQTNKWYIGSAVGNDARNPRSIYISNNGGASCAYNTSSTSSVFAYRELMLDTGVAYDYSYHWRCQGENRYDFIRIAVLPESVPLAPGNTSGFDVETLPTDAIPLDGGSQLCLQSNWQTDRSGTFSVNTPGTYRLVLYWRNDGSAGSQPPAAVDNISIVENNCGSVANATAVGVDTNSIRVQWTGGLGPNATFTVEYGPQGFTRGTGTVIGNIATTQVTVTGLQINTYYDFYVGINCPGQPSVTPVLATGAITSLPITLPYITSFTGTRDNALWTLTNGTQTNRWYIGTATGNGDSRALYISNSNGLDNAYSGSQSVVFAFRSVDLTTGNYAYSYDWKGDGESNYDYLRVALVPASEPLVAGNAGNWSYNSLPNGSFALDGGMRLMGQTTWQTVTGTVNVTRAGNYNLVFFWRNDGSVENQPPAAIDNVMFRRDNCSMPVNVTVSNVDSSSLTLTWNVVAGARWIISYGTVRDTVNANQVTLTGLNPGTQYNFRVQQLCDDGPSFPVQVSATTLCGARPLPYSYGFEDASGSGTINYCWRMGSTSPSSSYQPYVSSTSHQGRYSFYANTSTSSGSYLVMPAFAAPVNRLQISFYARRYSTASNYRGNLRFGMVANPNDISTFQPFASIVVDSSTVWNQYTVYSDTYTGQGGYVCVLAPQGISGYNDLYLDDFEVEQLPECSGVGNIVARPTYNSAVVTWHETGAASRWGVEYGPHGFSLGSGTFVQTTDTTCTLTGLQATTDYDVYIYSDCGHGTSQPTLLTFSTLCGPVAVPFSENFDSYTASTTASIGMCWYKASSISTPYPYPSTTYAQYSGSKSLYFYSSYFSYSYAVLPMFADTIQNLMMRLKVYKPTSTQYGRIQVGVMSDPTDVSTFRLVQAVQPAALDEWTTFSVSFANVTGRNLYMAIMAPSNLNYSNYAYVDDVEVMVIPPCGTPTNLAVSDVSTATASVSWSAVAGASYYRVEYGPVGFESGIILDSVSTIYQQLTGLQPGTVYEVRVSGLCNSGLGYGEPATVSFTTLCGEVSVPYSENFDSYTASSSGAISPCWTKANGYGYTNTYPYPTIANPIYDGSKSLYFQGGSSSYTYSYAVLPMFDEDIQSLQMSIKVLKTSSAGRLTVGVMGNPTNFGTFVPVDTLIPSTINNWQNFTVRFDRVTGSRLYICLAARSGVSSTYYVQVDDIIVDTIPVCGTVSNLRIDNVAQTTARVRWDSVAGATGYLVEYGPVGFPVGFGNTLQTTSTYADLTGLTAATSYTVYVRSICSATNIGASTGLYFQTDCALMTAPYSYGFEDATGSTAAASISPCWKVLGNNANYPRPATSPNYEGSYSYLLYSNSSSYSCAVLPKFADSVQNLQLVFRAYRQNNRGGYFTVGVMTDPDDFSTFQAVRTTQVTSNGVWQQYWVNFSNVSGSDLWMAIATPTRSQENITYIDHIEVVSYCPYSVNLQVMDSTRGTVAATGNSTSDGRFYPGTVVTLTATPAYGYVFGHWAAGNSANPYSFTMPANNVYYNNIVFNKRQFTVTANTSNPAFGTVSGGGSYDYLDTATLTANPIGDYAFYQWSDGDSTNPRRIAVTRDTLLTAVFGYGCPSVFESDTAVACESYTWAANGVTYTTGGIKLYTHRNAARCTLVDTLHLTINHASAGIDVQMACDSLVWHGNTYTASTTTPTFDTLNAVGCDSVATLHLTINRSAASLQSVTACDGYTWHGTRYTASTIATDTLPTAAGCDSVVTLNLTINYSSDSTDIQSACDSLVWHGTAYRASTNAPTYTTLNSAGCDSVVTLNLTIRRSTAGQEADTACDYYIWHGRRLAQSGRYADTLVNTAGCDSVTTLELVINPSSSSIDAQTGCDRFVWHGFTFTASTTTASYTTTNHYGCDSVVTLHLTLGHSNASTDVQTACDSLLWHGTVYTESTTTPTFTATNAEGCDSVVTLHLTVIRSVVTHDSVESCDSLVWRGRTLTSSGTYYDTLVSAAGCDSVLALHLTLFGSVRTELAEAACDTFLWRGVPITRSGDYTFHLATPHGCDSAVTLHLTVNASSHSAQQDSACDRYSWAVNGATYTETGIYTFDSLTAAGCDSTITLNLVVSHSQHIALSDTACDGYEWHGDLYRHSGTYTFDSLTTEGCDYQEQLTLIVNSSTHGVEYRTVCDTFRWHGQVLVATGTYTHDYLNASGCPSTDTLHLTVDHHSDTAFYVAACDSYRWNDSLFTESGVYIYDYSSQAGGCTNVDTLYLTINRSVHTEELHTVCDSYLWNGRLLTESGTYYLDTLTAAGCDSTVRLDLTVGHSSAAEFVAEACDQYTWGDTTLTESGTYHRTLTNADGCDSLLTLYLTIHPSYMAMSEQYEPVVACDSLLWNGRWYNESGLYSDTLSTVHGCDSLDVLYLEIYHSVNRTDTVTACDSYTWVDGITYNVSTNLPTISGQTAHGCDSVLHLDLTVNYGTHYVQYQNYCDTFTWHGQQYAESGTYSFDYLNDYGCASSDTLHLTITSGVDTAYYVTACDSYSWNDSLYTESGIYLYDYSVIGSECTNVDTLYLTINHSTAAIDSVTACDSYTWIDGQTYTESTYGQTYTLTNLAGCDSVVTLDLTIHYNSSAAFYDTINEGETYLWSRNGELYTEAGTYFYNYATEHGCASTDTLYLHVIAAHDTNYYVVRGWADDTVMGYVVVHPDTVIAEYDAAIVVAVPHGGYRFLHWNDGDTHSVRVVVVTQDTTFVAFFERVLNIDSPDEFDFSVVSERGHITVEGSGLAGRSVVVYDVQGRIRHRADSPADRLTVDAQQWPSGVYFVQVGRYPARRVVLCR